MATLALLALLLSACAGRGNQQSGNPGGQIDAGKDIVVGGSFPFSGPFATFGSLSKGAQTYFDKINAEGGVGGHKIQYKVADDAYDPQRLQDNARGFVEQDHVSALMSFGVTNLSIRDYMNRQKVPQFALSGNAPFSEVEKYPYSHAWWPDISGEDTIMTRFLLKQNPNAKIGLLGLANDLSDSQTAGIERGGGKLVKALRVAPNTVDLASQVSELRSAGVDTLFFTFAGPGLINTLKYMAQVNYRPTLVLYSGASQYKTVLQAAGLDTVQGAYNAMWLKDPADPKWANDAGISAYKTDVAKYGQGADPDDELVANGYGAAAAVVASLKGSKDFTSVHINEAWNSIKGLDAPVLQPGAKLNAGPGGRLVYDYQVVRFQGKSWVDQGPIVNAVAAGAIS